MPARYNVQCSALSHRTKPVCQDKSYGAQGLRIRTEHNQRNSKVNLFSWSSQQIGSLSLFWKRLVDESSPFGLSELPSGLDIRCQAQASCHCQCRLCYIRLWWEARRPLSWGWPIFASLSSSPLLLPEHLLLGLTSSFARCIHKVRCWLEIHSVLQATLLLRSAYLMGETHRYAMFFALHLLAFCSFRIVVFHNSAIPESFYQLPSCPRVPYPHQLLGIFNIWGSPPRVFKTLGLDLIIRKAHYRFGAAKSGIYGIQKVFSAGKGLA